MAATTQARIAASVFTRLCAIQKRLHQWAEQECNGAIQWEEDSETGAEVPRRYGPDRYGSYTIKGPIIPNQESKLLKEADKLAAQCGGLVYHQTDPRGCALYFYRPEDLRNYPIDQSYSTVALACVK